MAGNLMGRKKMVPAPVSRKKKTKNPKGSHSSFSKQIGTWSISDIGPLFLAGEAGGFGVLSLTGSTFSDVWG